MSSRETPPRRPRAPRNVRPPSPLSPAVASPGIGARIAIRSPKSAVGAITFEALLRRRVRRSLLPLPTTRPLSFHGFCPSSRRSRVGAAHTRCPIPSLLQRADPKVLRCHSAREVNFPLSGNLLQEQVTPGCWSVRRCGRSFTFQALGFRFEARWNGVAPSSMRFLT